MTTNNTLKIDCVSDLHGNYPEMEGGDLLIIAGDCTNNDHFKAWEKFFKWLERQNYRKKIIVAGNHDNRCKDWATTDTFSDEEHEYIFGQLPLINYLCDSGTEFEGLKIWGSPWTAWFKGVNPKCTAFMIPEEDLKQKWDLIPKDVDILITHSPPFSILDSVRGSYPDYQTRYLGSRALMQLMYGQVIMPRLHIFGHIHDSYGTTAIPLDYPGVIFVNASHVNEQYVPVNKPITIYLPKEKDVCQSWDFRKDLEKIKHKKE